MPAEEIFLSYSRNDLNACIALRAQLEQTGFSVFKDDDSIRQGERWVERLEQALENCQAFVLLIGRDGVQRWVAAEVQVALIRHLAPHDVSKRLPIFPVLLDGIEPTTLPPFLSIFQAQRWSSPEALPETWYEAIRQRLTQVAPQLRIPEGVCPFLGLRAFTKDDAKLFFGRRKETLEALAGLGDQSQANPDRLETGTAAVYHRWLQIEGNSGAGKSSLVAAGMLPLIEQGWLWPRTGFAT